MQVSLMTKSANSSTERRRTSTLDLAGGSTVSESTQAVVIPDESFSSMLQRQMQKEIW
ncbi:MAG: hypothetical protein ACLT4D_12365 [Blautia faecis]